MEEGGAAIHPSIAPISFLLGTWRGEGEGGFPTINSFKYGEEIKFTHSGKPVIAYMQKTWKLASGEPMHAESGYWRPKLDGSIEVIIAQSTGLAEVQKGTYDAEKKIVKLQSELVGNASKECIRIHVLEMKTLEIYLFDAVCMAKIQQNGNFRARHWKAHTQNPSSRHLNPKAP